jgi:hypothetical protein
MRLSTSRTPLTLRARLAMSSFLNGIVTLPVSVTTPLSTVPVTKSKIVNRG